MVNWNQIKTDALSALEEVFTKAAAAEPTVVDTVESALTAAGAPGEIVDAAVSLFQALAKPALAKAAADLPKVAAAPVASTVPAGVTIPDPPTTATTTATTTASTLTGA